MWLERIILGFFVKSLVLSSVPRCLSVINALMLLQRVPSGVILEAKRTLVTRRVLRIITLLLLMMMRRGNVIVIALLGSMMKRMVVYARRGGNVTGRMKE